MAGFPTPIAIDVHEAVTVDGHNSTRDPCGDFNSPFLGNSRKANPVSFRTKPRSSQLLSARKPINKRKAHRLSSPFKPKSQQTRLKHVLRPLRVAPLQAGGVAGIKEYALQMIQKHNLQDNFYAIDLGRLDRLYKAFQAAMPRVRPFYAVKCNPDKGMVSVLASMGAGFDCASKGEMAQILEAGVSPADIIFAHPCKRPACLDFAASQNIMKMTFDSESELEKIAAKCPNAKCVLRIKADDPDAVVVFGAKYGAHPYEEAPRLLAAAKRLGMNIIGVSFHVGSGSQHAEAYSNAIAAARHVFDLGRALDFQMDFLDIGGGFFGRFDSTGDVQIHTVANAVNNALAQYFPLEIGVTVIAEPGRYFAEGCCTLFCMVHTVKETRTALDAPPVGRSYFITDGVYGSFNGVIYDHGSVNSAVLRSPQLPAFEGGAWAPTTVFGPTCDGIDLIYKQVPMPLLRVGDWLQFPDFGAYSIAGACPFNGLPVDAPSKFYVWSKTPVDKVPAQCVNLKRGSAPAADVAEALIRFVGDVHDLDILT